MSNPANNTFIRDPYEDPEHPAICFELKEKVIMKLCANGNIYVKGELCENNKEVVDAAWEFFLAARSDLVDSRKKNV